MTVIWLALNMSWPGKWHSLIKAINREWGCAAVERMFIRCCATKNTEDTQKRKRWRIRQLWGEVTRKRHHNHQKVVHANTVDCSSSQCTQVYGTIGRWPHASVVFVGPANCDGYARCARIYHEQGMLYFTGISVFLGICSLHIYTL